MFWDVFSKYVQLIEQFFQRILAASPFASSDTAEIDPPQKETLHVKHHREAFARMRKRIEAAREHSVGYSQADYPQTGNPAANRKNDDTSTLMHSPSSPFASSADDCGGDDSGAGGSGADC